MLNLSPPRMDNVLYTVPIIIGMRIAYYYRNENSVENSFFKLRVGVCVCDIFIYIYIYIYKHVIYNRAIQYA